MGGFSIAVLVLLLAGALASWIVGALAFARARAAIEGRRAPWLSALAWPLGMAKLREKAANEAALTNKAIVAFFVCMTLAVTTISLSTNFNRLSH